MDKLTSPIEAYELLQEMKPKGPSPEKEPQVKIKEILKLYEKTQEVINNAILEMDIDCKEVLYGMSKHELEQKLDEVVSEKIQLEDYLNLSDYDLAKELRSKMTLSNNFNNGFTHMQKNPVYHTEWETYSDSTTINIINNVDPMGNSIKSQQELLIFQIGNCLTINPQIQDLDEEIHKIKETWSSLSSFNSLHPRMQKWIQPYMEMFIHIIKSEVSPKMLLYSNNKKYIIGFRDTSIKGRKPDTAWIKDLANKYAQICRKDASVKHIEIYPDDKDLSSPIVSMKVQIYPRKEIHIYDHTSGKRVKIETVLLK